MEKKQMIKLPDEMYHEELLDELKACKANLKLAMARYEFSYAEDLQQRIQKLENQLAS
jgi:hypothetical protein